MKEPITVLVVDDSALMRNLISKMLDNDPGITVIATAMNGEFALEKIKKYSPDVIILDLEMPVLNGIDFLKRKRLESIYTPVIILSSMAKKGARITMEALSLGASDFILKPSGSISRDIEKVKNELIQLVKVYGLKYKIQENKEIINEPDKTPVPSEITIPPIIEQYKKKSIEIIAIGISTGGPNALRQILPHLNKNLPAPILIVQHMPAGFTEEFAKSLNRICPLEVKEAEDGDLIREGRIFIAPGDSHLKVQQKPLANTIHITQSAPVNGHRPSVDVLFASVAKVYNKNCMAIIMTGMGKDGVHEIGTIYKIGGLTIAQEGSTCIVPGMPLTAIRKGYIRNVVPLAHMAEVI
ncbi:MAG: chemotaxis response regulator protein-glutamate methylesterase, partial [Spirochaetales bacterium]|nr:chemotaxis response regulator protein-glutamate methylesterase [Spirochaetales bacterium]